MYVGVNVMYWRGREGNQVHQRAQKCYHVMKGEKDCVSVMRGTALSGMRGTNSHFTSMQMSVCIKRGNNFCTTIIKLLVMEQSRLFLRRVKHSLIKQGNILVYINTFQCSVVVILCTGQHITSTIDKLKKCHHSS